MLPATVAALCTLLTDACFLMPCCQVPVAVNLWRPRQAYVHLPRAAAAAMPCLHIRSCACQSCLPQLPGTMLSFNKCGRSGRDLWQLCLHVATMLPCCPQFRIGACEDLLLVHIRHGSIPAVSNWCSPTCYRYVFTFALISCPVLPYCTLKMLMCAVAC